MLFLGHLQHVVQVIGSSMITILGDHILDIWEVDDNVCSSNGHHKDMCYDEIGLIAQIDDLPL